LKLHHSFVYGRYSTFRPAGRGTESVWTLWKEHNSWILPGLELPPPVSSCRAVSIPTEMFPKSLLCSLGTQQHPSWFLLDMWRVRLSFAALTIASFIFVVSSPIEEYVRILNVPWIFGFLFRNLRRFGLYVWLWWLMAWVYWDFFFCVLVIMAREYFYRSIYYPFIYFSRVVLFLKLSSNFRLGPSTRVSPNRYLYTFLFVIGRPLLWSSGQSSWLQIRRPVFDSRLYQKK
jgi:hypothetical protein